MVFPVELSDILFADTAEVRLHYPKTLKEKCTPSYTSPLATVYRSSSSVKTRVRVV